MNAEQPIFHTMLAYQSRLLSKVVSDTVFISFAPGERFTRKKLLDLHYRYTRLYNELAENLRICDVPTSHLLVLQ